MQKNYEAACWKPVFVILTTVKLIIFNFFQDCLLYINFRTEFLGIARWRCVSTLVEALSSEQQLCCRKCLEQIQEMRGE